MDPHDLPRDFHKVYPFFGIQNIPRYPNQDFGEWRESFPKFNGDPNLEITHVLKYMTYDSRLNVLHEYVLIKIFVSSLESSQRSWLAYTCDPKNIPYSTNLIEDFLRNCDAVSSLHIKKCTIS
jgi:hypothetical protein